MSKLKIEDKSTPTPAASQATTANQATPSWHGIAVAKLGAGKYGVALIEVSLEGKLVNFSILEQDISLPVASMDAKLLLERKAFVKAGLK